MNKAMKYAKKELEKIGFEVVFKSTNSLIFRNSNGREHTVTARHNLAQIRRMVAREIDRRRERNGDFMSQYPVTERYPVMLPGDVSMSKHFGERVTLMSTQGLNVGDVKIALYNPTVVRAGSDVLFYCYGDIAVTVSRDVRTDDKWVAVTLLWTSNELWELNPRPEVYQK